MASATTTRSATTAAVPTGAPLHPALPASVLPDGYIKVASDGKTPSHTQFSLPIEKSPHDEREYRLVRLDNGLEALLVHDAKADKAAASMSVNVGHLSDPEDLQGLAHFCEHLLFMGTEKFPKENDYSEYLARNSGSSNAFTSMDDTNYFFDVHPSALPGALDRFAQFFICPLFSPSCTEREIRAVDSEHKKNLQSDMWRLYQLDKATSSREHAYWRFGTGNLETLWDGPRRRGVDVRDELLDFHRRHYSANVMKLVVLGPESLDVLTSRVVECFSPVPNKDLRPAVFSGSPYGRDQVENAVYAKTVKDAQLLEVSWSLPDQGLFWATKPGHFLSHYIGHEGNGSLLSLLKRRGWANSLRAGSGGGTTGFDFFKVTVDLTEAGLAHHQECLLALFAYLRLLRSTPPQEWAFKEVAQLNELGFRFKEQAQPADYVLSLSGTLQKPIPRNKVLSAPWLAERFDAALIERTLEALKPEDARIVVGSKVPPVAGLELKEKERWYGTEFASVARDGASRKPADDVLEAVAKGQGVEAASGEKEGLWLPPPNEFIPQRLDVERTQVDKPATRPTCVRDDGMTRVWHKKDDKWFLPKAEVFVSLKNPLINSTPASMIKAELYCELVKDALSEYSYDADLAGLLFSLYPMGSAIELGIGGYNDKLPVLAKVVLERMRDLEIDPNRFAVIKEVTARNYRNFRMQSPSSLAGYWMTHLTYDVHWAAEEKEAELLKLEPKDLEEYIKPLFKRMHIETLAHGNVFQHDAIAIAELAQNTFKPEPLTLEERLSPRSRILPRSSNTAVRVAVPNPSNVNSAVEHLCYVGDVADQRLRCLLFLYAQIIHEPCFNHLRTKQQLGYIVGSQPRRAIGFCAMRILVQSEREASFVEGRIEHFLADTMTKLLADMTDDEFEREKESLVNKKLEERKNAFEEAGAFWLHIESGYYDFTQRVKDAETIRSLTKADVVAFHDQYIHPSSSTRAKVSVHLQSQHIPVPAEALAPLVEEYSKRGLEVDEAAVGAFMATKPDLAAVRKFTVEYLDSKGVGQEDKDAIVQLVDGLVRPTPLPEGVTLVENVAAYRNTLEPGPHASPVQDVKDLLSKL